MKFATVATVLAATTASAAMVPTEWRVQDRVPGEYMVALQGNMKDARTKVEVFSMVNKMGGAIQEVYEAGWQGAHVSGLTDEEAAALMEDPMVRYVEPNYLQYITEESADACVDGTSLNWGLARTVGLSPRGTPGSTQFPTQRSTTGCGEGVELYILDTGVRRSHDEWADQSEEIFIGDYTGTGQQDDDQGHGSHVASTAGGAQYGVAPCAITRSLKVCNRQGQCPTSATTTALQKVVLDASTTNKKIVVNMSLGGGFSQASNDNANAAAEAGAIVVAAAGNSNADSCSFSPASGRLVYSVMSSDINDRKSSFSNYGACSNIWAPGSAITAALHNGNDSSVRTISGTSMACPHVAGAMAVTWSRNPTLDNEAIQKLVTAAGTENVISSGDLGGSPNLLLNLDCL